MERAKGEWYFSRPSVDDTCQKTKCGFLLLCHKLTTVNFLDDENFKVNILFEKDEVIRNFWHVPLD